MNVYSLKGYTDCECCWQVYANKQRIGTINHSLIDRSKYHSRVKLHAADWSFPHHTTGSLEEAYVKVISDYEKYRKGRSDMIDHAKVISDYEKYQKGWTDMNDQLYIVRSHGEIDFESELDREALAYRSGDDGIIETLVYIEDEQIAQVRGMENVISLRSIRGETFVDDDGVNFHVHGNGSLEVIYNELS